MCIYIHLVLKLSTAKMSMRKISNQDFQTSTDAINKIFDRNKEFNKSTDLFSTKRTQYIANEPADPRVFEVGKTKNAPKINKFSTELFLEQKNANIVRTSIVVPRRRKDDTNHGFETAFGNMKSTSMNLDDVEISSTTPKTPLDTTFDYLPVDPETQTVSAVSFLKSTLHKKTSRKSSTMKNITSAEPDKSLIPTRLAFPSIGNYLMNFILNE